MRLARRLHRLGVVTNPPTPLPGLLLWALRNRLRFLLRLPLRPYQGMPNPPEYIQMVNRSIEAYNQARATFRAQRPLD